MNDIPFAIRLRGARRATLTLDALAACRKRWAIGRLFADAKRRGLNFEDAA